MLQYFGHVLVLPRNDITSQGNCYIHLKSPRVVKSGKNQKLDWFTITMYVS